MNPTTRGLLVLCALVAPCFATAQPKIAQTDLSQALQGIVSEHRDELGVVGFGAMVMRDGEVVASAVAGERKHGSGVALTDKDKWHLGSITKSFTATMIGRLVEREVLRWDTTIGEVFSDVTEMNERWRSVTLAQLLTHTSGASSSFKRPWSYHFRTHDEGVERTAARETLVADFLKNEPAAPAGTKFMYSNAGYLIAGVMAERKTNSTWEDLIRKEIFAPLQLRSGGFGHPEDSGRELGQPRGHKTTFGFIVSAEIDPVLVIGPAGSIHMSLSDLLVYANDHLQGAAGRGKLLTAETYQRLQRPVLDNYAYGWVVMPNEEWAQGAFIWHNGSNGMWDALLALLPGSNTIIAVTSNDGRRIGEGDKTWPILEKAARLIEEGSVANGE
jgi:CubicO group peptidase (beta-lactamase class C family)